MADGFSAPYPFGRLGPRAVSDPVTPWLVAPTGAQQQAERGHCVPAPSRARQEH
jgi:hypothetical protein